MSADKIVTAQMLAGSLGLQQQEFNRIRRRALAG